MTGALARRRPGDAGDGAGAGNCWARIGSTTMNVEPAPGVLRTVIVPPWAWMIP
jgi:hypothetical protein